MQIAAGAVNEKCSCQSCITCACVRYTCMYMFVVLENSNSSVAKTKRRVSVRYGCSDSSKLNMPLEHFFTRQCTANFD